MTGARDRTQLCFSSNLAGIMANKVEQSFYSVYSYSGIESIERALSVYRIFKYKRRLRSSLRKVNDACTKHDIYKGIHEVIRVVSIHS